MVVSLCGLPLAWGTLNPLAERREEQPRMPLVSGVEYRV